MLTDYSVLLVDGDLRRPAVLDLLGPPRRRGFVDYLTADTPLEDLLIRSCRFDDLVILPGGDPLDGPIPTVSLPRLKQLTGELIAKARNRITIIDLPPLLTTPGIPAFSPHVDAALLVIEDGVTTLADAEQSGTLLGNTVLFCTVLNDGRGNRKHSGMIL